MIYLSDFKLNNICKYKICMLFYKFIYITKQIFDNFDYPNIE